MTKRPALSFLSAVATVALCATPALAEKRVASSPKKPVAAAPAKKVAPAPAPVAVAPQVAADDIASTGDIEVGGNTGTGFDVFSRKHDVAQAKETEPTLKLKGLGDAQMSAVTKARANDIEYCWDRLAQNKRVETTAVIKLAIEPIGSVASSSITGESLHPEFKKCVAEVAARWRFPVADAASELEFAVALQSTKIAH